VVRAHIVLGARDEDACVLVADEVAAGRRATVGTLTGEGLDLVGAHVAALAHEHIEQRRAGRRCGPHREP